LNPVADVVVIGAGIAGVSVAYHLGVLHEVDRVTVVDPRPPLTLTSDKSTECYRNWWPNAPMVGLMNRSIDLFVERVAGIGIFNPALGGDPVLFQHFFWFYSHPAVYIMILPAMAVMSELITTFAKKHIFGYEFIAYSSIGLALLSFLVWGHHMFVSGQSSLANMVFSALTFSVAIPSAIKVFNWVATLYKADIRLDSPMLYALMFILLFSIGGLTGIFLGTLNTDVHLHDTYFVIASFAQLIADTAPDFTPVYQRVSALPSFATDQAAPSDVVVPGRSSESLRA